MTRHIVAAPTQVQATIAIPGSKSEANRALILQALFPDIRIDNLPDADDVTVMQQALSSSDAVIDIGHAGTAMRFLTAYYAALQGRTVELRGSGRMHQRPIGQLVEALDTIGADISWLERPGFPPLRIKGTALRSRCIEMKADVSSQFITALMLIASKLPEGLQIDLTGRMTSIPYIKMTASMLQQIGIPVSFKENRVSIGRYTPSPGGHTITIESDWSSASYFYAIGALADPGSELRLSSYRADSLQGDRALADIFLPLGVETIFLGDEIILRRTERKVGQCKLDLSDTPDIAQTIAVCCAGMGVPAHLTGLHTLKIKETDRLLALEKELTKLGCRVVISEDSIQVDPPLQLNSGIAIETYSDHRMAMSFAVLGIKVPLSIIDPGVVSKSFPTFWDKLQHIGYRFE